MDKNITILYANDKHVQIYRSKKKIIRGKIIRISKTCLKKI